LGDKFVDIEEKYDLSAAAEGFGREGDADNEDSEDEAMGETSGDEEGGEDY